MKKPNKNANTSSATSMAFTSNSNNNPRSTYQNNKDSSYWTGQSKSNQKKRVLSQKNIYVINHEKNNNYPTQKKKYK